MTLVFQKINGALQQLQIRPADVVATISMAQSAWGWVGGLTGVRHVLNVIRGSFAEEAAKNLATDIRLGPAVYHIFTSAGCTIAQDEAEQPLFGEDFRTRLVGLSICALAHVCGSGRVVQLFMDHLAPTLFKVNETTEALYLQLVDNQAKILNEGAARGLTRAFTVAVDQLHLPHYNNLETFREPKSEIKDGYILTDSNYVVGFLRWLVQQKKETYFTRSNVVAQLAACLREVGYFIGPIQAWDGSENLPRAHGSNAVVLVTGGSWETDPFMDEVGGLIDPVYHFHFKTTGAMFSNSLRNRFNVAPEVFQTIFEQIYSYIESHLTLHWKVKTVDDYERFLGSHGQSRIHHRGARSMRLNAEWNHQGTPSSISVRLASINFPLSAEFIAPCYDRISNPESLEAILHSVDEHISMEGREVSREVAIFRAITASIVISMASRFAGGDFKTRQHCTCLDLASGVWLATICQMLDETISARLELSRAVFVLAAVHAGCSPSFSSHPDVGEGLIGWRNGIYSVMPSVIIEMAPSPEALGLRCFEGFWANVAVRKTGAIFSGPDRTLYVDNAMRHGTEAPEHSLQSLAGPYIGSPSNGPPDIPLYLNIERSPNSEDLEMCFCGRIGGMSVGVVGIKEVMYTLALSLAERGECRGHPNPSAVVNITASTWAAKTIYKPVGVWEELHTFIPVQNDPCWAIFLAGQSSYFDGRVVYGCVSCAAQKMISGSVLVGYV